MMLLLSPTKFEAAFLEGEAFGFRGRTGLRGKGWVWLECGIGKVNTALTLAAFAQHNPLEKALLFGIAGAYVGSGLEVGEVALAECEIQADLGLREGGMQAMGFPTLSGPLYNRFPLDAAFTGQLQAKLGLKPRPFLTQDVVSSSPSEAAWLRQQWGADLENMEGAAFAQACVWLGIAGAELRSVSNVAGVRDKSLWRIQPAIAALGAAVGQIIDGRG